MKKTILSLSIMSFIFLQLNGQKSSLPDGLYLSHEQLKNKTPEYNVDLSVIRRSSGDIAMVGGNEFKLESTIDTITKKFLKNSVYSYVKDSILYINCLKFKLQWWYAKGLTNGRYILFRSAMPASKATNYAVFGGAIGGLIASSQKYLNILDLTTGKVELVSDQTLSEIVKGKKEVEELYQKETENSRKNEETIFNYINLMNN
jgi:hypothetical protein